MAAALGVLLVALAVLQYRWLGDVSAAERERMRTNLRTRAADLAQAFDGELTRTFVAFRVDPAALDADAAGAIADAYARAQSGSPAPMPIRAVYLVDARRLERVERFDPAAHRLDAAAWPSELRDWMTRLQRLPAPPVAAPSPLLFADAVDAAMPALVIAIPQLSPPSSGSRIGVIPDSTMIVRALVVEIDADVLRDRLLKPLVGKYFGDAEQSEYTVAIVRVDDPSRAVFVSDPAHPLDLQSADVAQPLFDVRADELNRVFAPPRIDGEGRKMSFTIVRRGTGRLFSGSADSLAAWRLLVRYRTQSLDAIVDASRRRNLAIVVAVLLLLAGSVGLILVSADRQRRMARQQMEFVAAVSHELRTPLAVIRSAGENLADGLVADRDQVRRYGAMVESEGRRLSAMVERVMRFAGMASAARPRHAAAVDVAAVVREAAAATESDAADQGVTITVHANGSAPVVTGDADALRSAVQNLVGNAVKYSASGAAVDVAAGAEGGRVRIRVADRGIGIDADDLPHVFQPFYRGRRAIDAQIRGSGIGLSLVRTIVDEHGGEVRVDSAPGAGTTVTIDLPQRA